MAGGKETPRQKMIGMMYLVLTALLALNVSKEILNAFVVMNESLETTNHSIEDKLGSQYAAFEASYNENPAKAQEYYDDAQVTRDKAKELINFITQIKGNIIEKTDGLDEGSSLGTFEGMDTVMGLHLVNTKDNYDVPSFELGLAEPTAPADMPHGKDANALVAKITDYKESLLALVRDKDRERGHPIIASIEETFALEGCNENDVDLPWAGCQFYHSPLAACVAALTKVQTDVRNVESDMVAYLYGRVDAASFKFNKLSPAVIANSSYLLQGDTFKAEVFLAAFDTTSSPRVTFAPNYKDSAAMTFGDDTLNADYLSVVDGKGLIKIPATSEGIYTLKGLIKFKGPEGYVDFPVSTAYQVSRPSLTVSPTKMNVFYKGVDNPVSVSVPGVPADKIRPSINNGSISKSGEGYVVRVKSGSAATISVSADVDGKSVSMGKVEFRVKTVPDPVPRFAGKSVGDDKVKKSDLTAAQGVIAKMENFDFDLNFKVTSFKLTMIVGGTPIEKVSNSNRVTGDMKTMLSKAKPGSKVYIENIKAKGPDGTIRKLGSIALKVI